MSTTWQDLEKIAPAEVVTSLKKLNSFYEGRNIAVWMANLYDPEIGGFYYSNSARDHEGFMPDIDLCATCNNPSPEVLYLDVMNGCLICSECLKSKNHSFTEEIPTEDRFATRNILLPITNEVLMAIRYVISAEPKRLFSFNLSKEEDINTFSRAGEIYLQNHLERGFDTLDFYHTISQPISKR